MTDQDLESIRQLAEEIVSADGDLSKLETAEEFNASGAVEPVEETRVLPTVVIQGARAALDPEVGEHRRRAARNGTVDVVNTLKPGTFSYNEIKHQTLKWCFGTDPIGFDQALDDVIANVRQQFAHRSDVAVDNLDLGGAEGVRTDTKVSGLVLRISKIIRTV